jgi:putative nucleotidyltransferase with HDIG domain
MNSAAPENSLSPFLARVRAALPKGVSVYLVGGALRDAMLGRTTHDLDFALPSGAIRTSRRVANALGGAFFPLDPERDIGRVLLKDEEGNRQVMDFAALRGPDLESDLRGRDFTINAMAVSVEEPFRLLDPLGGAQDLRAGRLRACSASTFLDDPVRILRCVRQAVEFNFQIVPETRKLIRPAVPELQNVSPERLRDEIFRILDGLAPATALRTLEILGVLQVVLPAITDLKGIQQSLPHTLDVYTHTLTTAEKLSSLINVLGLQHNPETAANWAMGLVSLRLGRYREQLHRHMTTTLNPDRTLRALVILAALFHDVGKPHTRQNDPDGRIRFLEHEQVSARLASLWATRMHLSSQEIERLVVVVRNHMRPLLLAKLADPPSRRAVYRFFHTSGEAGVDICLLSLADTLATYGPTLPQEVWTHQLDVVRMLLEAWWEEPERMVSPPALLNGGDIIRELGLQPGPQIGQLLEAIREAQAAGEISSREQALALARLWSKENPPAG